MPPALIRNRIRVAGDFVGPYRIERQVGEQGGFGQTYEVVVPDDSFAGDELDARSRSPFLGIPLALKLYLPSSPDGSLAREARALRSLRHDNIARYVDEGSTNAGEEYLVAEYVDGATLYDYCVHGERFTVAEALPLALQLLDAIASFHPDLELLAELEQLAGDGDANARRRLDDPAVAGIVHRDITLRNVVVRESDGAAKLIDFGLSLPVGATMRTQHHTAGFWPPWLDSFGGRVRWDASIDVFQVGALLYRITTGQMPHHGRQYLGADGLPKPLQTFLRQVCDEEAAVPIRDVGEAINVLRNVATYLDLDVPADGGFGQTLLDPFDPWPMRPVGPVLDMPGAALGAVITEIAAAEGPVLRRRIYRLVAQASGNLVPGVQPDVDRELNALLLEGRLDQIEPLGLSHPDTSVIAIDSPTPIPARCLGNRAVWEISRAERDAIVARVRSTHLAADAADVARHLGLSERSWETQLVERWLS